MSHLKVFDACNKNDPNGVPSKIMNIYFPLDTGCAALIHILFAIKLDLPGEQGVIEKEHHHHTLDQHSGETSKFKETSVESDIKEMVPES